VLAGAGPTREGNARVLAHDALGLRENSRAVSSRSSDGLLDRFAPITLDAQLESIRTMLAAGSGCLPGSYWGFPIWTAMFGLTSQGPQSSLAPHRIPSRGG
jgi:hypothetical protein